MRQILFILALINTITSINTHAEPCGPVSIAEFDWPSSSLLAHLDKIILNHGYGCQAVTVPGDTMPTFASMVEKNRPDIAPEIWENAYQVSVNKALDEGKIQRVNPRVIPAGSEGWYVNEAFAKAHPEIKTVVDVIKHPELFPNPEYPGKGVLYDCPSGWGCQTENANLFKAFNMESKGWMLVDPGSPAGLDGSISKASIQSTHWFGFYYQPSAMVTKYNMQLLPWGVPYAGDDNWDCITTPDCTDPKPSAWIGLKVSTLTTKSFLVGKPTIQAYLQARSINEKTLSAMLEYMEENQVNGDIAARIFLAKYPHIWQTWVPETVAKKILASLKQ